MGIKDAKLVKGMSRDEVNKLIGEWISLEDKVYLGVKYIHNWKCKTCGEVFQINWDHIKHNKSYCECVKYDKQEQRYKYEVEKTGEYEYIRSYRKSDVLPNGKIITGSPWLQIKHKYCGSVYEIQSGAFINTGQRCGRCCQEYENSLAHYIEVELGEPLDKYWDFEKNTVNPYYIYKNSNKNEKVWIKCQNEEINKLNGLTKKDYHGSYEVRCSDFTSGSRCPYCNTFASGKVHKLDSYENTTYVKSKCCIYDNNYKEIDMSTISTYSAKKYYIKCPICNRISSSQKSISNISSQGFSCEYCSDGVSIPEKFMVNILEQLNIKYINQLSRCKFNWCKNYKYDFYIPSLNMIIETHGLQHYEWQRRGRTLDEEQENDRIKKALALNNYIENYMVIDCRESTLEWLKENITKELSPYFNLSNIDWDLAWKESQNSLCVKAWELWNDGYSVTQISDIVKRSNSTVRKYLKRGRNIEIVDYDEKNKYEYRKDNINWINAMNNKKRSVILITTKMIFKSIIDANKFTGVSNSKICMCCKGKRNSAGKLQDETPLVWRYLKVSHNRKYRSNEMYKLHSKQIENIAA